MKLVVMLSAISIAFALLLTNVAAQGVTGKGPKILTLRGRVESVQVKEIDRSSDW